MMLPSIFGDKPINSQRSQSNITTYIQVAPKAQDQCINNLVKHVYQPGNNERYLNQMRKE